MQRPVGGGGGVGVGVYIVILLKLTNSCSLDTIPENFIQIIPKGSTLSFNNVPGYVNCQTGGETRRYKLGPHDGCSHEVTTCSH